MRRENCDRLHRAADIPMTNFQIDETLLQEALALGNHHTTHAAIEAALREYIQRRKQLKILELFGTIDYDEDYHYKQQRQKP